MQLAFSKTALKTFTEPQVFDQLVEVVPHPDDKGQGIVALKYLDDGKYASYVGFWKKSDTAGAGERFVISGNLLTIYIFNKGEVAVFGCVQIVVMK